MWGCVKDAAQRMQVNLIKCTHMLPTFQPACSRMPVHACLHRLHTHTYMHTCIHAYIHTPKDTCITYIHTYIHTYIQHSRFRVHLAQSTRDYPENSDGGPADVAQTSGLQEAVGVGCFGALLSCCCQPLALFVECLSVAPGRLLVCSGARNRE
jgi:hypothetical protein